MMDAISHQCTWRGLVYVQLHAFLEIEMIQLQLAADTVDVIEHLAHESHARLEHQQRHSARVMSTQAIDIRCASLVK